MKIRKRFTRCFIGLAIFSSLRIQAQTRFSQLKESYSFDLLQASQERDKFSGAGIGLALAEQISRKSQAFAGREIIQQSGFVYDPVLFTIAASLESRDYDRGENWDDIVLETNNTDVHFAHYQKPVPAHFKNSGGKTLLISLGSSFSTWKRGSWVNKIVYLAENLTSKGAKTSTNPVSFLAFAGQSTPEILESIEKFPDPTGFRIAVDYYFRIKEFLKKQNFERVGLIGYSGGASIALHLLRIDSDPLFNNDKKLFGMGGIALNPLLDPVETFWNLDIRNNWGLGLKLTKKGNALTTLGYLIYIKTKLMNSSKKEWEYVLSKCFEEHEKERHELWGRFFHEFVCVDLDTVYNSSSGKRAAQAYEERLDKLFSNPEVVPNGQDLLYREFFTSLKESEADFNHLRSVEAMELISSPLYIVLPKDDVVLLQTRGFLGDPEFLLDFSARHKEILLKAESNKSIELFTPRFGGHMGYFLDTVWLQKVLEKFLE
jgi:hypothetical protein